MAEPRNSLRVGCQWACCQRSPIEQGEVDLETGDMILMCSDGITEAMNENDEIWDEAQLLEVVRSCSGLPAKQMIEQVVLAVNKYANGAEQSDDITVTVMSWDCSAPLANVSTAKTTCSIICFAGSPEQLRTTSSS